MTDGGFTFHDDVTEAVPVDPVPDLPDGGRSAPDWDDPDTVIGLFHSLRDQFSVEVSDLVARVANDVLGGGPEALLVTVCALSDAMGDVYATDAAVLDGLLAVRHHDWLPEVNGEDSMDGLRRTLPDMTVVERAFAKLAGTGDGQTVHLPDAGHDVAMTPLEDGSGVEFSIR